MTDVVFVYKHPIPTFDTATRFPIGFETSSGDDILQIDGSSFIQLIDTTTIIALGH